MHQLARHRLHYFSTLLLLAIVLAQADGVVAEPVRIRVPSVSQTLPEGASCPFVFRSEMPANTFCVYRGTAYSARGEACATDVVAIWSSYAVPDQQRTNGARELYVGFVGQPELVLRAQVNQGRDNRAELIEATMGETLPAERLSGSATLERVHRDGDTLRVAVDNSEMPGDDDCAFASYVGSVIGTVGPPDAVTRR